MTHIPMSIDVRGLIAERQEIIDRVAVIEGVLRLVRGEIRKTIVSATETVLRAANGTPMHGPQVRERSKRWACAYAEKIQTTPGTRQSISDLTCSRTLGRTHGS